MKTLNKEELKKSAAKHFAANPLHELYHVTADGQCFTDWHNANEHSKTIGAREMIAVRREEIKSEIETAPKSTSEGLNVQKTIELINQCTTEAEVKAIADGDSRKTVTAAAEAKIKALADV